MVRIIAAALFLAGPWSRAASFIGAAPAAGLPTFESALQDARRQALAARARDSKDLTLSLARELEQLAGGVQRHESDAERLRWNVQDIQRRAQRYEPGGSPSRDPFLRHDVDRAVWDLRRLKDDLDNDERNAARVAGQASKDPALVPPAQRLYSLTRRLRSETGWLASDARWAATDLRRAGFTFEAWDLERESSDVDRLAGSLDSLAGRILSKVQ